MVKNATYQPRETPEEYIFSSTIYDCSGKYIDIYFILKITYPISTLPEHLHSTIPNIHMDGRMCWYCKQGVA